MNGNIFQRFSNFIKKNLTLSISVALSLILILATVITVLATMGSSTPGAEEDPSLPFNPITNGLDERVYYYDLPGGETLLSLKKGWKFTLIGPESNKSGDYALNGGNAITLDFVRDQDGTATATVEGNKVVLSYNGATLTFREKVDYSVTFNTNGGSAVDAVSVTNGKTVSAPTSPTKADCDFVGWFADEGLTKPFNFGVTLITADTVIYAKWTQN